MKTEKNILIAFMLNLAFSIFEFIGGCITNSIAITSDAIHDIGDAMSIGLSYFLENKSKKEPDEKYTYGYVRYSVIGSLITTIILVIGSVFVMYNAVTRIITPIDISYNGMIIFAVIGVVVNFLAAYFTKEGASLNQKAVNLHMLEDVLGWTVVLIGAIIMKFTDAKIIDPILSIGVAIFIFKNAISNLQEVLDLFLEKTPKGINIEELKEHLLQIEGVKDIHHIHVRSMDGYNNFATLHAVIDGDVSKLKELIKEELKEHGINHTTIEIEMVGEKCCDTKCEGRIKPVHKHSHQHRH